jgi:DNA ligase (NAD+)
VEIVKKANQPQMPDTPYIWSKTGVEILIDKSSMTTEESNELQLKNIEYFFDKVDVHGLSGGIINKIYLKGFNTIGKIINISMEQLLTVDGFKDKMANKIATVIHEKFIDRGSNIDLYLLMDASNILGRGIGSKKIKVICDNIPDIIKKRYIPTMIEMTSIKGIETKTAKLFIDNLPMIFKFFDDNNLDFERKEINKNETVENISPTASFKLSGKTFVFSGVRDKDLEKTINDNGGTIGSSVSSKTHMLIVKTIEGDSSKIVKAKSLGVVVITLEDFKNDIQ